MLNCAPGEIADTTGFSLGALGHDERIGLSAAQRERIRGKIRYCRSLDAPGAGD